ncbi:protein-methionine-sulfoxide reductase heme-binding subunit MsrQ [Colwelliaceae bacterium MEBiC 14330]
MNVSQKVILLKSVAHIATLLPLLILYYHAFTDQLGADPVEAVINFTGIGAFNLLLITLAVSPIAKTLKQGYLLQVRRLLGLYAFTYAALHIINFMAFDLQFAWSLFFSEIFKRPYISIGAIAFMFLTALALTSPHIVRRKMGKSWQTLHNVNYLIVMLVGVHFYWSVKSELITPIIYLALASILLLCRFKKLKSFYSSLFCKKNYKD